MAQQTCPGCSGVGSYYSMGNDARLHCGYCSGTGSIWQPDPPRISSPAPRQARPKAPGSFEDFLANVIVLGVLGLVTYYGMTRSTLEWYWPVGAGFVSAMLVHKLLSGPLRTLLSIIKYLLLLALIGAMALYYLNPGP